MGTLIKGLFKDGDIIMTAFSPAKTRKHLRRTHVSQMFPSFATRETLFPGAKHVSASRQKHFLLSDTLFLLGESWETSGTRVRNKCFWQLVSNIFPRFARPEFVLPVEGLNAPTGAPRTDDSDDDVKIFARKKKKNSRQ